MQLSLLVLCIFIAHGFWDVLDLKSAQEWAIYISTIALGCLCGNISPTCLSTVFIIGSSWHMRNELGGLGISAMLTSCLAYPDVWGKITALRPWFVCLLLSLTATKSIDKTSIQWWSPVVLALVAYTPPIFFAALLLGSHMVGATVAEVNNRRVFVSAGTLVTGTLIAYMACCIPCVRTSLDTTMIEAILIAHVSKNLYIS